VRIHSIRSGTEPGTHRVLLAGAGESLEIVHRAQDRTLFARGALRAVRFLHGRAPGIYSFQDVIANV
jgi:4-hydroxy-tetrahydrodipicolinate reductase